MMDGHLGARLMENRISREPTALNTLIAVSPSFSSESSSLSDLDTESTGSFFIDNSITLGNLIGLHSDSEVQEEISSAGISRRNDRRKWWNLCGNAKDCYEDNLPPSLGQFLEVERKAAASSRRERMHFNVVYDDYSTGEMASGTNSLFGHGRILPPRIPSDTSSMPLPSPPEWFSADHANSRRGPIRQAASSSQRPYHGIKNAHILLRRLWMNPGCANLGLGKKIHVWKTCKMFIRVVCHLIRR